MRVLRTSIIALAIAGCTPEELADTPELPLEQAAMPFNMTVTDAIIGENMTFSVVGANPSERIYVVRSLNGLGQGACLAPLGNNCFDMEDPVELHTNFRADATGAKNKNFAVPDINAIDGLEVCFQAVAIRGTGGANTVMTTPRCVDVGFDSDNDDVLDANDQCPGEDDWFDWDLDGIPDGCDVDQPPVFENAVPDIPFTTGNFQGRGFHHAIPANPVAILWMFHGGGGGSGFVESMEQTEIVNEATSRNIGIVALSSGASAWNGRDAPGSNADWQAIDAFRDQLINQGRFTATTTSYVWGFSSGGEMASFVGHAAPARWRLRAGVYYHAGGRSSFYGQASDMPAYFITAVNDNAVNPATVLQRYQEHIGDGYTGRFYEEVVSRLAPTRFDRSNNIRANTSITYFRTMVEAGYFNKRGVAQFGFNDIDGTIDDIVDLPGVHPDAPVRAVLNVVLASHQVNSQRKVDMFNFLQQF